MRSGAPNELIVINPAILPALGKAVEGGSCTSFGATGLSIQLVRDRKTHNMPSGGGFGTGRLPPKMVEGIRAEDPAAGGYAAGWVCNGG